MRKRFAVLLCTALAAGAFYEGTTHAWSIGRGFSWHRAFNHHSQLALRAAECYLEKVKLIPPACRISTPLNFHFLVPLRPGSRRMERGQNRLPRPL